MVPEKYQSCIDACDACADACDYCSSACLQEEDVGMMVNCIRLDMDCAGLCRLASSYMARDSAYSRDVCRLCVQVCEACGAECARHPHPHCQACAQACRHTERRFASSYCMPAVDPANSLLLIGSICFWSG